MDNEKDISTAAWLKFFKDAGIPTKTGASYALIFVQNRINKDMLSELTVDYLRLMGITLMGDIIAILRHCKSVHQDSLRKVVILQSKETPRKYSTSETSASDSSESSSSSEDDVEMVEVTKPISKKAISKPASREISTKKTSIQIKTEPSTRKDSKHTSSVKSKVIGKISSSSPGLIENEKVTNLPPIKRKYSNSESGSEKSVNLEPLVRESSKNTSILKTAISSSKRIKVVEEEAVMGPKLPPPKRTVFERLGAENDPPQVTSTTELPKPEVVETKFTRTISRVNLPISAVKRTIDVDVSNPLLKQGSSVFDRLGGLDTAQSKPAGTALEYAGVFKSPPKVKKPVTAVLKKVGTMRADQPEVPVKLRAATRPVVRAASNSAVVANSVKRRLGHLLPSERSTPIKLNRSMLTSAKPKFESEGIFANTKKTTNLNVKDRLGLSSQPVRTSSSFLKRMGTSPSPVAMKERSQFSRLGVPQSQSELLKLKKVSFGRVEQKIITPVGVKSRLQRNNFRPKTGVHSRLGIRKY